MDQVCRRTQWIDENLDITHSTLSADDAKSWLRLLMKDRNKFVRFAVYGYSKRRMRDQRPAANLTIPGAELKEFISEFIAKIQLANAGKWNGMRFPLFSLCGPKVFQHLEIAVPDVRRLN